MIQVDQQVALIAKGDQPLGVDPGGSVCQDMDAAFYRHADEFRSLRPECSHRINRAEGGVVTNKIRAFGRARKQTRFSIVHRSGLARIGFGLSGGERRFARRSRPPERPVLQFPEQARRWPLRCWLVVSVQSFWRALE